MITVLGGKKVGQKLPSVFAYIYDDINHIVQEV